MQALSKAARHTSSQLAEAAHRSAVVACDAVSTLGAGQAALLSSAEAMAGTDVALCERMAGMVSAGCGALQGKLTAPRMCSTLVLGSDSCPGKDVRQNIHTACVQTGC